MTTKLSQRVRRIQPSPTLAVTARAKALRAAGKDIIGLGAGEPDFDTPDHIKAAAIQAINDGMTKYTPVDGTPALKQAIVEKFSRDNDLEFSVDQVLVSCGGKQSFYNLAQALLDAGDEVIIPAPYWVSYPDMVLLADATPVIVDTTEAQGFRMSAAQLEAAITDNTRLLVLNSPSNPTGSAYTLAELIDLSEVLLRHPQVMIATDDMYEHILWRDEPFSNIVNANAALMNRTIVLNGVSKAYSMTGWRIGYAAGPADLIGAMKKIQSQSTSNPASISQAAATAALNGDQGCIREMVSAFKQRHDYLLGRLNSLDGVSCRASEGTFYAFPSMQGIIDRLDGVDDDVALAEHFLNEIGVAMVPGSAFGAPGYMRLSYATSMDNLENALDRIETFLKSL
jgi:aspartate aminotransferase